MRGVDPVTTTKGHIWADFGRQANEQAYAPSKPTILSHPFYVKV